MKKIDICKCFVLVVIACCSVVKLKAQGPLGQILSVNIKQESLEEALYLLIDQANIDLSFSNDIIPDKKITLKVSKQPLRNVLDLLLRDTKIKFRLVGEQIVLYEDMTNAEKKFTISGFVEDARTGERLIGVSIYDTYSKSGTTTNSYGFYSLTLKADRVALKFSYVGYLLEHYSVDLNNNIRVNISLTETVTQLKTVTISSDSLSPESSVGTSVHAMNEKNLSNLPGFGGERDIIRSIHLLPGVQTGTDGIGGLSIRGGSPDENLILIDDVPVYNFTHGAGLYSIVNSDAVQRATLYKSEFPARFNGRLSSILDIRTKDGNKKELKGSAGINVLGLKGYLEGPIIPGKSSFFISARQSAVNWFLKRVSATEKERNGQEGETTYNFQDLNLKLNHEFSPTNRLFLSVYRGSDNYEDNSSVRESWTDTDYRADIMVDNSSSRNDDWENTTASLRWNSVLSNQLFANTTLIYSNLEVSNASLSDETSIFYLSRLDRTIEIANIFGSTFASSIKDYGAKIDLNYLPAPNHNLKFGGHFTNHFFKPGAVTFDQNSLYLADVESFLVDGNARESSQEFGFYLEDEIQINDKLFFNGGLAFVNWSINEKDYQSWQPRFSLVWEMDEGLAFMAGYSRMEQFIHRLFRSALDLPSDLWVPSTETVGPKNADIFSAGMDIKLRKDAKLNVGAFYKKLNNLIEYSEGANFINNWEENVTIGQGSSYGLEFLLSQSTARSSIQLSYTLSYTNREFDNINLGREYPYRFDRRHNSNISFNHKFNDWLDLSATWVFNTGFAFTVPRQQYYVAVVNTENNEVLLQNVIDYGNKNEFRMPDYHRLDLNLRGLWTGKTFQHSFSAGVYNLYNRRNPLYYRLENELSVGEDRVVSNSKYTEAWLMPIVPHLDYSLRF